MATFSEKSNRRGPRTPGLVFTGLTLALVLTLVVIALTTRQPPPPTIAEFAPQAVEQIKDAPTEQSSEFGSGEGGSGLTGGPEAPAQATAPKQVIDVPRVRRCIGDPPRQIEDPQSPPCVPYWEGANGGATWKGVTANEIRIMVPTGNPDQSAFTNIFPVLERFFNKRFEFYGRKLVFIYEGGQYPNAGTQIVADQIATATNADEKQQVFASLRYRTAQGFYYHEELARRRIPSFTGVEFGGETAYLTARRPYLWQYVMEADGMLRHIGEWACGRLVGVNAVHSGASEMQERKRKFGIVLQTHYNAESTTAAPLEKALQDCGATDVFSLRNPMQAATGKEDDQGSPSATAANNVILQMSTNRVTSVFCVCQPYAVGALMKAATNQAYFPEWLLSSYGAQDTRWGVQLGATGQLPHEQLQHTFGLAFTPRQIRPDNEPYYWAVKEADPAFLTSTSNGTVAIFNFTYRNILQMASAIQMAGPNLTPDSIEKGLQRTVFPNPDHANRPGKVGFRPNRYGMTTDGAEWWWSLTDLSPYGQTGTHCYVDRVVRHTLGNWPRGGDPFFKRPCDSGA